MTYRFDIYKDTQDQWRWRFIATNGRIISVSSEAYVRKADCEHSINIMKKEGPAAPVV